MLPKKTSISMASGVLHIEPIWKALGPEEAKALPAFHVFTGVDHTGRFTRIGKQSWFKLFLEADKEIIKALGMLSDDTDVTEESLQSYLASFVCSAYCSKGIEISDPPPPALRWHLFCKYTAESERLPSTTGTLKQHIFEGACSS